MTYENLRGIEVEMVMSDFKRDRIIGYNIARVMKKNNVSIEQLSCVTQIPEIQVSAILTGSVSVENDAIDTIARGLGVQRKEILCIPDDESLKDYNVHCMGCTTSSDDMNKILDKIDLYVRLLNTKAE